MIIACVDCGMQQILPRAPAGATVSCWRCHSPLERTAGRSIRAALACSAAGLALLLPADLLTLLTVRTPVGSRSSHLFDSIIWLWGHHWVLLAAMVMAYVVVIPLLRGFLLTLVLACIHLGHRPDWLGPAFRWTEELRFWSMPDVFLLGFAITYSRIVVLLDAEIGVGGWCMIAAAFLLLVADAALDRRTVWRAVMPDRPRPVDGGHVDCDICGLVLARDVEGERCPRCRRRLAFRRPAAMARATALVIAGTVLYLPANYFPLSLDTQLGQLQEHTILDGVHRLVEARLWPLAVVVLTVSIAIPLLKLVGLAWLMLTVRMASPRHLVLRTRAYRLIDEVGRWAHMDVFTVVATAPLLQFGMLANVQVGSGAVPFALVASLTMLASRVFDPRLMWDAAGRRS